MKKLMMAVVAMIMTLTANAQKRLVLIEEFTNTGCGPCATWSPLLDSCIHYRLGDCIAIKYHSRFPLSTDEFYCYDPESNQAKVDYYNVTGVPATFVDGVELGDRTFDFLNTAISYSREQPAAADIHVTKELNNHQLKVKASFKPYSNLESSRVRLNVVVIEEHIASAIPWNNGEKELNYTMRKMLTPTNGYQMPDATLTAGTEYSIDREWTIDFMDDERKLGVVAFLQNIDTRQILATAYAGPDAEGENRLTLAHLYGTPDMICMANYFGTVILRNDGANTITRATLNVKVNDAVKQYEWTGKLDHLDRDTMQFSGFTDFTLRSEGKNDVALWLTNINGSDAAIVSNTLTSSFSNSIQARHNVQLKIYTDKKPEEITWKLYNSAGDVVRQGGPYDGQARKFITTNLDLTDDDCYQLEFLDAGDNGIKGANGNGYYQLFEIDENGKSTRISQGDYSGSLHHVYFNLTDTPRPQQQRLVLFEEFTNTSCDPCADFSPALDQAVYERLGDMVAVTYHYNFPSPQDPFYLANTSDVMTRAAFYDVSGVPALRVDGEPAHSYGYNEYINSYIDGAGAIEPKMDIDAEASLEGKQLKVSVSLVPKGITDGSNLRLYVAVVEERIEWATPAANGETAWNYVMRKLLPTAQGQPLDQDLTKVTPYQYDFAWTVANFTDENELGIVAFVQDSQTHEVLATVYTPRPTGSTCDIKILKVLHAPARLCSPQFKTDLMVRNTGRETLTQANINVSINGQVQSTPWKGRLNYLDVDTISTPLFTGFTLAADGNNQVEIWLSDLNGNTEQSLHKQLTITPAHQAQHSVRLTLMTDNAPEEITWKLYNSAGDVVQQGGPYTEVRKKQVIDFALDTDDCYMLQFSDAGGDGITAGRGYYMLQEVNAEGKIRLLEQSDYSTARHEVFFSLQNAEPASIDSPAVATKSQHAVYDLQGRRASEYTPLIIIDNKKIINNKK